MIYDMIEFLDKKRKAIIKCLGVFLLFHYGTYSQYIPVIIFHLDVSKMTGEMKVLLSTFSSILTAFILFFLYRKELKKEFEKFWKNKVEYMDIGIKYWFAGLGIMMVTNLIINLVFRVGGAGNEKLVQEMIHALPWLMIIDAGILAPFNEEIVFRKTIHDIFGEYKICFVFLSFLLFGLAHVVGVAEVWKDYLYIIPYGALGGAFAYAYSKTDTIFTSMLLHMAHNTILIILSVMVF